LQLLNLSSPRRALGLLRSTQGKSSGPQGSSGSLRLGRQMPAAGSVCQLWLRHALGANRSVNKSNGREFSQFRSLHHWVHSNP